MERRIQPSNQNFLSPTGFRFQLDIVPHVDFYCQQANLPGISLAEVQVNTPVNPLYFHGDTVTYEELTIQFICDENMVNFKEMHDWIISMGAPQNPKEQFEPQKSKRYSDGVLTILTGSNVPQIRYKFKDCFPTSLQGVQFDVTQADIQYLTTTASFRYNYFEIEQIFNEDRR